MVELRAHHGVDIAGPDAPGTSAGVRYTDSFGFEWNRFSRTQLDSANGTRRSRDAFVEKTGWTLAELRGRRVLDAGCGMGRFSEIAADAGADVHAVDLSEAVIAARKNLGGRPNVHVYRADIMALPFKEQTFDFIYSIGVLHHTPNTKRAFMSLVPLLRPGGQIAIWVYAKQSPVMIGSDILRLVTPHLPKQLLLRLARVAVPLYRVHQIRRLGALSAVLLPTSIDPDPEWRWLDTFDWYSPRYQWKHTYPEVEGWFQEAGLVDVARGPFPVSVRGRRP